MFLPLFDLSLDEGRYVPVASFRHFLVKLSLAAPDNFLSAACLSQAV
jgi:hypothetical protein